MVQVLGNRKRLLLLLLDDLKYMFIFRGASYLNGDLHVSQTPTPNLTQTGFRYGTSNPQDPRRREPRGCRGVMDPTFLEEGSLFVLVSDLS